MKNTTPATAAIVLALTVSLTGCAGPDDTRSGAAETGQADADVNDAGVRFATMVLPHHEQAIEVSDIVLEKDGLEPEVEQLEGWLDDWGVDPDDMSGMDHGSMSGMMSAADLAELRSAEIEQMERLLQTL